MSQRPSPKAAELDARIRALFYKDGQPADVTMLPRGSPYRLATTVEEFAIPLAPDARIVEARDADTEQDAADEWLDMPSPTFGGHCPRHFLDGTEAQRAFLAGIVASMEDGAFS